MKRVALMLLLPAGLALGQRGRSVEGIVKDSAGTAITGATVQCENPVTLAIRSYITRKGGRYRFRHLSPDITFNLKARYKGRWSKEESLSKFNGSDVAHQDLVIPVE